MDTLQKYWAMFKRLADIRIKGSNTRLACLGIVTLGILIILGGNLLNGLVIIFIGLALKGIRDKQDRVS